MQTQTALVVTTNQFSPAIATPPATSQPQPLKQIMLNGVSYVLSTQTATMSTTLPPAVDLSVNTPMPDYDYHVYLACVDGPATASIDWAYHTSPDIIDITCALLTFSATQSPTAQTSSNSALSPPSPSKASGAAAFMLSGLVMLISQLAKVAN
ncbi:hypothetical protein BGW80DRAFT_1453018 [Lactifluus volemus]|nr:hypothetical protein BGW80DRAFT_1453018 [Lactifluus volemus]